MTFVEKYSGLLAIPVIFLCLVGWIQEQPGPVVSKAQGPAVSPPLGQIEPQSGSTEEPPDALEKMTYPELRYRLIERFGSPWYCDPDRYPVARGAREEAGAIKHFPAIRENARAFHLIAKHLGLEEKADLTTKQKVLVYHEFKKVQNAIQLEPDGNNFRFTFSVPERATESYRAKGFRIVGRLDSRGLIIASETTGVSLACPI